MKTVSGETMMYEVPGERLTELGEAERERNHLREVLERIAAQQPKTLAMIEANGFVFTDIGKEPGNWQHLAFSIYTDLCEVDSIARSALPETAAPSPSSSPGAAV